MIPIEDLTDVTLAIDDTEEDEDIRDKKARKCDIRDNNKKQRNCNMRINSLFP